MLHNWKLESITGLLLYPMEALRQWISNIQTVIKYSDSQYQTHCWRKCRQIHVSC